MHPASGSRHNLPTLFTPLVGREREVAAITELLRGAEVRLLTLTGPGGIGKTRLSLQVALECLGDFTGGVFFVPLGSITNPELVIPALGQTLEVRENTDQPLLNSLKVYLQDKQLLLLLDNFEHVLAAAPQLMVLLATCPGLKILVTSQAMLRLSGEYDFPVPPLELPMFDFRFSIPDPSPAAEPPGASRSRFTSARPDLTKRENLAPHLSAEVDKIDVHTLSRYPAIELFIQRARAALPTFELTGKNALAVAEICLRLDGVPLAIELAAARVRLLPPQAILSRLVGAYGNTTLQLLTRGARDLPARQQALCSAIEWSYQLLDESEKALFRRLAVFAGGFTLEAAEAVIGDRRVESRDWTPEIVSPISNLRSPISILDGLASLEEKSLLRQMPVSDGEPRFGMLETIRQYALEQLESSGEAETVRLAHARFFQALAEEGEYLAIGQADKPKYPSAQRRIWLDRLETEHDNLRTALAWSRPETDGGQIRLHLVASLYWFWYLRGYLSEGRSWAEVASGTEGDQGNSELRTQNSELRTGVRAKALFGAGLIAWRQGDFAAACAWLEASIAIWRELHAGGLPFSRRALAYALSFHGVARVDGGEPAGKLASEEAVALLRQIGDKWGLALALNHLGTIASTQGDYDTARPAFEESMVLSRQLGDKLHIAAALAGLSRTAHAQDNPIASQALAREAVDLFRAIGDKYNLVVVLNILSGLLRLQGDTGQATTLVQESLTLAEEVGSKDGLHHALHNLGYIALRQGDLSRASQSFEHSLDLAQEAGPPPCLAACLAGLAAVALAGDQPDRAARLFAAAESLCPGFNPFLYPADQADYGEYLTLVLTRLDEEAVTTAWMQGQTLSAEEAIAVARERISVQEVTPDDHRDEEMSPLPAAAREPETPPVRTALEAPGKPVSPTTTGPLAELTAREIEVLRLLAQGLTDVQIADQLVLSPRTVTTHVHRILSKLDATSRSAATRIAVEQGLV